MITTNFICGTEKLGVTNEDFADFFDGNEVEVLLQVSIT